MSVVLESNLLRMEFMESGTCSLLDRGTGVKWESRHPGWVTLSDGKREEKIPLKAPRNSGAENGRVDLTFGNLQSQLFGDVDFGMSVTFYLTDRGLDIKINELHTGLKLVNVEYPAHLLNVESGTHDSYVVVPFKQGVLIPSRLDAGFMRFMHNTWGAISDVERWLPFESGALNMPWFGATKENSSLFCYVSEAADCTLHVIGNAVVGSHGDVVNARQGLNPGTRLSSLSPVWKGSHNQLGYERTLRLEIMQNGYVGMAKRYLEISKSSGRYVSLKEKIKNNPLVERIIGAPDIKIYIYTNRPNTPYFRSWSEPILDGYERLHTTFKQVREMARDLKQSGIDKSLILLGGWNRNGYDNQHVDMWPPAEIAGGTEELAKTAREVTQDGYLFSLHDNYQDFYEDAPSYDERFLMKHEDQSVQLGGTWDGGLCRLICSQQAFELADRNLDLVQDALDINSYYLDTTTAAKTYECFDHDHLVTRVQDRKNKWALMRSLNDRGLVVGGEGGTDWAVSVCAFFEGLPGSSVGYSSGVESASFGLIVPLFNLVYHDAVVCYWQHGQPFGREDHANHVLHDLMSGQPSSWSLIYEQWNDLLPLIRQTYGLLANFHRRTAHEPMVDHRYLTHDFTVHQTRFGDGSEVIVNFGIVSYEDHNGTIPPKGFALKVPGEDIKIGAMNRDIVYR